MASAIQIRTVPRPDCFLCGGRGKVLHQGLTDRLFSAPGTWCLRKCSASNCEFIWLDPFPIAEDVPKAYETYYTHDRCADPGRDSVSLVRDFLYRTYRVTIALPGMLVGIEQARWNLDSMFLSHCDPGVLL